MKKTPQRPLPQAALVLSVILLVLAYSPVLKALLDPNLQFQYGDFQTKVGPDSAQLRKDTALFTYTNGDDNLQSNNRFFILTMFSSLSDFIPFSDTQFHAGILLASMLLGCFGLYLLVLRFEKRPPFQAALIILLCLFYFLNFWAVDRIAHVWIWFTYAVFPLFIFLGLEFVSGGDRVVLVAYSLSLSFFGFLPHSFMYLMMLHAVVVAHSLLRGRGLRESAILAVVPVIIYAGANFPAVAMFPYLSQIYPFEVDKESPYMLSRNGELLNVLSFSNTWWPQIPYSRFSDNPVYRYSGIMIFALCCAVFARAYGRIGDRALLVLCLLAVLAFIFVAQGTRNPLMEKIINEGIDLGLGRIMGLFREWGRISIMIPVFLCLGLAISLPALRNDAERISAVAALGVLLAANLLYSPSWDYMALFGAKPLPDSYAELKEPGPQTAKAILFVDHVSDFNYPFQTYPYYGPVGKLLDRGPLNRRVLDALNVYSVFWDPNSSKRNLSWMDCRGTELVVCENPGARGMFYAYGGAIGAPNQTKCLDAALLATGYAVADSGEYYVYDNESGNFSGAGKPAIILEAERDFGKLKKTIQIRQDPGASSARDIIFLKKETLARNITIPAAGTYMLALKGNGEFLVRVGESFRKVFANESGFAYFGPMNLTAGQRELRIGGENDSALDVVWIYRSDRKLDEAFPTASARVTSQERITPALWKATVVSDGPFILSFAEPYNGLFEARVKDGSGKMAKLRPMRVLGGINGFRINQTGHLEVEVRFTPQDAYSPAFLSTFVTLLCCGAYVCLARWKR